MSYPRQPEATGKVPVLRNMPSDTDTRSPKRAFWDYLNAEHFALKAEAQIARVYHVLEHAKEGDLAIEGNGSIDFGRGVAYLAGLIEKTLNGEDID